MYLADLLLLLLPFQIFGFNIDTNHFIVYVNPQQGANYFGYTVMLYPGDENGQERWVKIGAPKGQDPKMIFKNSGVVYNCPWMDICQPVDIRRGYFSESEILSGSWIGGSMDISYRFQRIAICGYRTIYRQTGNYGMVGACYLSELNSTFKEISPLKEDDKKARSLGRNKLYYYYGQGQLGFSTHFTKDKNEVILGAPGVCNWAGTVVKVVSENYDDPINQMQKSNIIQRTYVADPMYSKVSYIFDIFGYAVNSGYFFNKTLYYVASTPKHLNYKGKVVIFDFNHEHSIREKTSVIGEQFGEYFGASIAVGDLNTDDYEDLMVGAPYHTENTYNEGAVYVFLSRGQGQLRKHHTLKGQQANGQFGSAIMFLGDINNDTFGDLAIGAPYEEESSGVLYIYHGNKKGIDLQPCQRIIGKDISSDISISGFGISISRPADIDHNGYNDLVVGAHLSGNAVLLRTNPVVVVEYTMKSIPTELNKNSTEFVLNICYWYSRCNVGSVEISRIITVDLVLGRAYLRNVKEKTKKLTMTVDDTICENITISLKKRTDYVVPIQASLYYKLERGQKKKEVTYISDKEINGTDSFCTRCPVLDEFRSSRPSFIEVPYSLGCGEDKICQADLVIEANFPDLDKTNTFLVGNMSYLNLEITISNTGAEDASTLLEVTLPDILTFRHIPPECYEHSLSIRMLCDIRNPIKTNEEKTLALSLDMEKVNKDNYETHIVIKLEVLTGSNKKNLATKYLTIMLRRKADIMIAGRGEQGVILSNKTYGMPSFIQIYEVNKTGYSPLEKVHVSILVPHAIKTSSGEIGFLKIYSPEAAFKDQQDICKSSFIYVKDQNTLDIEVEESLELESTSDSQKLFAVEDDLKDDNIIGLRRKKRRKRVANVRSQEEDIETVDLSFDQKKLDVVPSRTYFINCSNDDIVCSNIECTIGPFESEPIPAIIQITMILDIPALSGILGGKDYILYSTRGIATVEIPYESIHIGRRQASFEVPSLFYSETVNNVGFWIVLVAIIGGILSLVVIVYGLNKIGFFKRSENVEIKYSRWIKIATEDFIVAESTPEPILRYIKSSNE